MHTETIRISSKERIGKALHKILQPSKESIELCIEDTLSDPDSYRKVWTPNGTITDLKPDIEDKVDCLLDILEYLEENKISEAVELASENGLQNFLPDWIVKLYSTLTRLKETKTTDESIFHITETDEIDEIDDLEF
jgi:hypothetical protein